MSEQKFEQYWALVNQSQYELPIELKAIMKEAMQKAGFFDSVPTVTIKKKGAKKEGPKKLSGYQLFVREKMPEVKADEGVEPKQRMKAIAALWKPLSDEDKAFWKEKANAINAEAQAEWDAAH
jgi:TRAP-type mannitol/chloroaromatic compound transport system substrate-binding protein